MPGQDGIETIRALRKEALAVRVVAMSGGGKAVNVGVLEIALQLGAVGILRKPFEVQEVLDVV